MTKIASNHKALFALVLMIGLVTIAGCSKQDNSLPDLKAENERLENRVAGLEARVKAAETEHGQSVTLYFVKNTPTELWLVPELRKIKSQPNMPKAALEELIKGPTDPSLDGLIPKDTKVLEVRVEQFIAYPSFSQEISRLSVGSTGEALVVASIANTLVKFPGIERVLIMVDGKPVESLAGHIDTSKPIGRNDTHLLLPETPK